MTLPHDYTRCQGHKRRNRWGWSYLLDCRDCLRRTAPCDEDRLYSYMQPPEFTDHCPERIAS